MNINSDPQLTGRVKHYFKNGNNVCGRETRDHTPDINVSGLGITDEHAHIEFSEYDSALELTPNDDPVNNKTYLNGNLVTEKTNLRNGDIVLFGNN